MFLLALLLFTAAIAACVVAIRRSARALDMHVADVLIWFGLAETPAPRSRRARR